MLHLLHVQRADSGDVANTSFTNYSLGKLHLGCDVSHIHRVIVVVCYIQGVLQKKIRHTFKQNEKNTSGCAPIQLSDRINIFQKDQR